jgi:Tfp pilus assembly PilM family ATPase
MSNLIALEWDDAEARVAVADSRRGSVVLEQAFSVALPKDKTSPEASGATGTISISGAHDLGAIGRRINDALTARGIRRVRTLVGVGRANIELKNLTLPPAPANELPELVRFQAEREFNTLTDEWPLDFLPIPGEEGETITVLAAAISPELVAEIQITCEASNLTPQRLILRPCAAASLLSRAKPGDEHKLRLLVDILTEEADLTVLAGDSPVFMRTARLPADSATSDPLRTLLPEIRRTIAAVHARFQGRQIEEIFLCGEGLAQETLAREIGRELNLPTEVFNPLLACTLGAELKRSMPEHPGRFAPLVGMLLDDAAGEADTIDFLNPRKKAEPKTRRRELTIAAAAAGLLLLIGAGWIGFQLHSLDSQIAELDTEISQNKPKVDKAGISKANTDKIQEWSDSDPNWLDELANLSIKAPHGKDFWLTKFNTPSGSEKRTANMQVQAVVKSSDVGERFTNAIRDERHVPRPKTSDEENKVAEYPVSIETEITITPPKPATAAKKDPAASGATAKSTASAPSNSAPTNSSETTGK